MSDQSDDALVQELRSYAAAWIKTAAGYFAVPERVINRCLSDQYGSVMNADLVLMYLRMATIFTALADGEIRGTPSAHEPERVFHRDLDLDVENTVPAEIRKFNVTAVKHLSERFDIPLSTINRGLHRDFGPVAEADTGQLFTRAAAILHMCAERESVPVEERASRKKSRRGHTHSETWWNTHKVYTAQVKRTADLYGMQVSEVNSTMHSRRGPVHDENDQGIMDRLNDLIAAFPELNPGDD